MIEKRSASLFGLVALLSGKSEGQVARCVLPIEGFTQAGCSDRIRILKQHDDLFNEVELPEGWSIVATEHNMWNRLLDEKKRERAAIFYKAAFYDRRAHMYWNCFYSVENNSSLENEATDVRIVSRDGETIILQKVSEGPEPQWERVRLAQKKLEETMQTLHKDWKNPAAYWT